MMSYHVLARVLVAGGLVAALGTALVGVATPLVQSVVSTNVDASAPPPAATVSTEPDGRSASAPASDTPSANEPMEAVRIAPPQPSNLIVQRPVQEWEMPTGSLAAQAPAAGVLLPAPIPATQTAGVERTEVPAPVIASGPKRVNINTATLGELNRLGGRLGKAIIRGRPYRSIDELVSKRVLTRATFGQIKGQITAR